MKRLILITALATSCGYAQHVTVEFDQAVDFSRFHTFAIRNHQLSSQNPAINSELTAKRIDTDIERYLMERGLSKVQDGPADLNVVYRLGSARKMETESYPAGWRGWGTRVVRVPYAEGTLVIDLRDPTTRSLVWRGISSVEKRDAAKIEGKLEDMVKKALEKYPPKMK